MSGRGGRDWARVGLRVLGAALLLIPFIPLATLDPDLPEAWKLVPPGQWLLGSAIVIVGAWVLSLPALPPGLVQRGRTWSRRLAPWSRIGAVVFLAALLPFVSWFIFRHRPLLVDSIVQLFQARIYASGRLTASAPARPAFFMTQHMLFDGPKWYSQYPPGLPALFVPGVLVGAPWLVPILLSLATALFLYAFVRRVYDESTARITILLLAACPFFWFMGASFMNHVPTLLFAACFLWLFAAWEDRGNAGLLLLAGAALGIGFLCRPLTAAAIAAPFAVVGAISAWRRKRVLHLAAGAVGFLALAAVYPLYNAATTGDPWLPGYIKLWGPLHGLGFHATPWGDRHTPLRGLRNELTDLQLMDLHVFEWPLPALWPVGAGLLLTWLDESWDRRLAVGFLMIPLAYFFYWHHDSYLGPRFLYADLVFVLPLTARFLVEVGRRAGQLELEFGGAFRPVSLRRWVFTTLGLCFVWAAVAGIPGRWWVYESGLSAVKVDLRGEARKAGIERGLVFMKVSAGNRLIARMRGLGVSASTAETAYRKVDFCDLLAATDSATAGRWPAGRLESELRSLIGQHQNLMNVPSLNGDPTLILRPGRVRPTLRLPPACADELRYDGDGYGNYTPDLVANRPDLKGPLVVARDLRGADRALEARYPSLPDYLYVEGRFKLLRGDGPGGPGLR